ncbi:MAG: TonB family protein, partial [Candidatus Omnitrophica bacterium]|nr:TonB family protein [Candidatus Omnitrophota bacterium]
FSKDKITFLAVDSGKVDNPNYLNYYQTIRERIKRAAYQIYSRRDKGEVYVSFAIFSDGRLQGVRIIEDKSSPNPYLREISIKSIQNASPFPPFPRELNYPQLSFNIIISFETE